MAKPLWGCCFFNKKGFKTTRSGHLTTHLTEQQTKVNAEISFADKAAKAKSLWQAKNAAKFNEIYNILTQMSVGVRIYWLNYEEKEKAEKTLSILKNNFKQRSCLKSNKKIYA